MSRQEILEVLIRIFSTMTDAETITESCELMEDLGISSMDLLTLISYMEEEFHITIPERSVRNVSTVGDLVDVVSDTLDSAPKKPQKSGFPFSLFKS